MGHETRLTIHTDGGARGNPGPAAFGVVIDDQHGQEVAAYGERIGQATNNQAEYRGLISALEKAAELGATELDCYLDSELLVKQMKREYRVKDAELAKLFVRAWNAAQGFRRIAFHHIPREQNKQADQLVNEALDRM